MGHIVLHVGMPKAGSSSIQKWLSENDGKLRDRGRHLLVYRHQPDAADADTLAPRERGTVNSGTLTQWYRRSEHPAAFLKQFIDALDRWTSELGTVILTGEGLAQLFAEPDERFLRELDALGTRHDVRVACYVRAQHESLEAAWRQWGFRHIWDPSKYVEIRQQLLDYEATRLQVGELAPNLSFEMRLFHRDAFADSNIVEDFARTFLAVDEATPGTEIWANPGLPLALVNVLRQAEPGRFWSSLHDNAKIAPLKTLTANWNIPEEPDLRRSRLVLQQYCHERFEDGNMAVARELGWPISALVPEVDEPDFSYVGLTELDTLWVSTASAAERELLFVALENLLAQGTTRRKAERPGGSGTDAPATSGNKNLVIDGGQPGARERRAVLGARWISELASSKATTPRLVRGHDGQVFLVEANTKRTVKSGILSAALEEAFGPCRPIAAADLDRLDDGVSVDLFESQDAQPFLILGGERRRAVGVPVTYPIDERLVASMARGSDLDVAHANVSRRLWRNAMSTRFQLHRIRSKVKREGVVGTVAAVSRRGAREFKKRTGR